MALAGKNIVLLMDGTWNSRRDNTNVTKLEICCVEDSEQMVKYVRGIGTRYAEVPILRHLKRWMTHSWRSGAAGHGIRGQICEAYQFLCQHYSHEAGDRIYLFGFSRGAFAARSLAGFADTVGLLLKERCSGRIVEQAYELYENGIAGADSPISDFFRRQGLPKAPIEGLTDLPVYFMGLWDTVASLGLRIRSRFSARYTEHHQHELPGNVSYCRHALALHEIRCDFQPLLLKSSSNWRAERLRQVWFPGSHGDVGGGFDDDTSISDVCFDWMADEAKRYGLKLRARERRGAGAPGKVHCTWSVGYAFRGISVRDELAGRGTSSEGTRATFDLHASSVRRLLAADVPCDGVTEVPQELEDVDIATVKMFDALQSTQPSGELAKALSVEISERTQLRTDVYWQLASALTSDGPLDTYRSRAILRRACVLYVAGKRSENLLFVAANDSDKLESAMERQGETSEGDEGRLTFLERVDVLRDQLAYMSKRVSGIGDGMDCPMAAMEREVLLAFVGVIRRSIVAPKCFIRPKGEITKL